MTPSINVRLQSVLNGLRDVILPAIPAKEALAAEQAGLILAQLSMLLRQLPYSERYHRLCLDDARAAATGMICHPAGGPCSLRAADTLTMRLAEPERDPHENYLMIAAGIAALTRAVAEDGEAGWRAEVNAVVLAFSTRQNRRERIWFRDAGFDANPAELPNLETYLLQPDLR